MLRMNTCIKNDVIKITEIRGRAICPRIHSYHFLHQLLLVYPLLYFLLLLLSVSLLTPEEDSLSKALVCCFSLFFVVLVSLFLQICSALQVA